MHSRSAIAWLFAAMTAVACTSGEHTLVSPGAEARQRPPRVGQHKQIVRGFRAPGGVSLSLAAPVGGIAVQDMNDGVTATQLAQALVGPGVSISNVTYTGAPGAAGLFASDTGVVGIGDGIVLSTGAAKSVIGPNQFDNTTTDWGLGGDSQLTKLVGNTKTYDASVLEFDVVPDSSTIYISAYVFGSEEYNEFVNFSTNDAMAFYVNGTNCALVNGKPVSVNTINDGYPYGTTPNSNPDLYRNNRIGDGLGATINTELDGLTRVLTCAAVVNKGVTNHVKLAIADVDDGLFDSDVFIGGGALTTVPPAPIPVPHAVATYTVGTPSCTVNGAVVSFDGTGSYETGGGITKYEWRTYAAGLIGTGPTLSAVLPTGPMPASLTVSDDSGRTDTQFFTVNVPTPTASTYAVAASPDTLQAAGGAYVKIAVSPTITGTCPGTPSYTVSSSQTDESGTPGDSTGDIRVATGAGTVLLSSTTQPQVTLNAATDTLFVRAETLDSVTDRLYTIRMQVNGTTVDSATVRVLHPQAAGTGSCSTGDQHGPGSAKHGNCDPDSNGDQNSQCTKDGATKNGNGKACTSDPGNGDDKNAGQGRGKGKGNG
ncbi:MAG: choice-of-anchor L domain-containing protein [Gemmatimonadota bacterium]|nr:choice-of-anchor L domain-containing protein [Gemmatimonadota bacterium]